jgi:sterol-4alpha-carboxylate 3-dehydrogenase (decarboxylating)
MAPSKRTALVVGGAGFLGKHIVQQLLDTKRYNVRVFDIRPCGIAGADMVVGDIRKQEDVTNACKGVDVVVHVATATPTSENALNKQLMDDVNVKGTAHVVEACKQLGIRSLVYTSSASGGQQRHLWLDDVASLLLLVSRAGHLNILQH